MQVIDGIELGMQASPTASACLSTTVDVGECGRERVRARACVIILDCSTSCCCTQKPSAVLKPFAALLT
jgi:hypothetical protein